ncbi:hypothetical protein QEN19_002633 [Hanseniaspora menglaensis]
MHDNEFTTVSLKSKKKKNKLNIRSQRELIAEKLFLQYPKKVANSNIFKDVFEQIKLNKFDFLKVRCLALGSFFEEIQPLYQLCFLFELVLLITEENKTSITISLYDPVFTNDDIDFIKNELNDKSKNIKCVFETEEDWEKSIIESREDISTLYYIPHGDLHLLEYLFPIIKPKYYLGNYILDQLLRVNDFDSSMKYLVNIKRSCYKTSKLNKNESIDDSDDFKPVLKNKKSRQNKMKVAKEPHKTVETIELYFKDITAVTDSHKNIEQGPWLSAFSSLALHKIE